MCMIGSFGGAYACVKQEEDKSGSKDRDTYMSLQFLEKGFDYLHIHNQQKLHMKIF
jgi:hypothetical protein